MVPFARPPPQQTAANTHHRIQSPKSATTSTMHQQSYAKKNQFVSLHVTQLPPRFLQEEFFQILNVTHISIKYNRAFIHKRNPAA